ncbi:hypothetical protein AAVH_23853 [Aphelenchoides avenae]|nr:hypothetical protein AAVH_23853 [Aphelenchus avenae]
MQLELLYDSLFFCPRDDLERTMAACKLTRKMVTAASNKLALRPIYSVDVRPEKWMEHQCVSVDTIEIRLYEPEWNEEDDDADYEEPPADYEASVLDGDFDAIFRRLQHVHVEYFYFDLRESPFVQDWMTRETDFTVKHIDIGFAPEGVDFDLFDSVMNFLQPVALDV